MYGPLLQDSNGLIQNLLGKLQDELHFLSANHTTPEERYSVIQGSIDVIENWERAASQGNESAAVYVEVIEPIKERLLELPKLDMHSFEEVIEEIQTTLDELWRNSNAPEPLSGIEMQRFLINIGADLTKFVQTKLSEVDFWCGSSALVKMELESGLRVCRQWLQVLEDLTQTDWPSCSFPTWNLGAVKDDFVIGFTQRLETILRMRSTYDQLLQLVTADQRVKFTAEVMFKPFSKLQPLLYNQFTNPSWENACSTFAHTLEPLKHQAISKLSERLRGLLGHPRELMREFQRFEELLRQPDVKKALEGDMELLLAQLQEYVVQLESEFSSIGREGVPFVKGTPTLVSSIVFAAQLYAKVQEMKKSARDILSDLSSFEQLNRSATNLEQQLLDYIRSNFEQWIEEIRRGLRDDSLSLEMTGRLMEISTEGLLVVNYSERLVTLLREVRQLSELSRSHATLHNLRIPDEIIHAAQEGEKYYRFGVTLKKVANFYNTIESQILPSQRKMLLEALLTFEQTVNLNRDSKGNALTWDNPDSCRHFVVQLQEAADQLSRENRRLRKMHVKMAREVVALMNTDLLRQREQWKKRWTRLQEAMNAWEREFTSENISQWKLHWDHQLYKAVEAGYQFGLESLNESLIEIKAELVFNQRQIQFQPPIEEMRASYYREMKKFVSIPNSFSGFGNSAIYRRMPNRNARGLVQVYRKAEQLFVRLEKLQQSLAPWTTLGLVDLEAFVEAHVKEACDWEENFAMVKQKRKDLEKLPDLHKVDCVQVIATKLKGSVGEHLQTLNDLLVISLKKNVSNNLQQMEAFLERSMKRLHTRPHSVEEIGKAKEEWQEISASSNGVKAQLRCCEEQTRLLRANISSIAHIHNTDLTNISIKLANIQSEWESFDVALEAFNDLIEEQKENIKSNIDGEIVDTNRQIEKFLQRWEALKPRELASWDNESTSKVFEDLTSWRQQFDELQHKAQSLITTCDSFNMTKPKFDALSTVNEDLEKTEKIWNTYKDYIAERSAIAMQDWISFRQKLFELEDFVKKWTDQFRGRTRDPVAEHVKEELELLRKGYPALKFFRGEPFRDEHWNVVFRKLMLPRDVRLDNLQVRHFLDSMQAVSANLEFAKELTSRAQGEVTLRDAIQELKAWSETAELNLMERNEGGRVTPLIKDWKDLLTEIGDNQSLLQSLKESPYFKPFEDTAVTYETKFAALDEYLHLLNQIQRKWVYLEPIFGRGALPQEQGRFKRVDEEFRDIMAKVQMDPKVFNLADESIFPRMRDILTTSLDQLERCQKALSDYLEEKRSKMPRFYFIGDDDLLEILGQSTNPNVIQSHLKKLFQGINTVEFSEDFSSITHMKSLEGESVPLISHVTISDSVEDWLTSLSVEMKATLKAQLVQCLSSPDLSSFPSQVLCVAEVIRFTQQCEQAIQTDSLKALLQGVEQTLESYITMDLTEYPLAQLKVKALVLDTIHNIDVVNQLISERASSLQDWVWQKQLRYYLNDDQECVVRMCDAEFFYTYEYQGNAPKLVHTPLTDKCYLTLTQGRVIILTNRFF